MDNVFVLSNTKSSGYRVLELANLYYEMDETRYAHPCFGIRPIKYQYKLYDYYSDYQDHTKKVIGEFNQASVWDFYGLSNSVKVAVIDDGVVEHEDLPSERILSGYDFADNDSDPRPGPEQAHGMGCAGIIAATHTTDSIFGMVPGIPSTSSGIFSLNDN